MEEAEAPAEAPAEEAAVEESVEEAAAESTEAVENSSDSKMEADDATPVGVEAEE